MHHPIHELTAMLRSNEIDIRDEALLHIGLLLEIHTFNSREQAQYNVLLPESIRRIVLDESQQKTLVDELSNVVGLDYAATCGALQSMRMAKDHIAFVPLLTVIRDKHARFNTEGARQALIGLERYLRASGSAPNDLSEKRQLMREHNTFAWLKTISDSEDPELKDLVERVVGTVEGKYS